MTASKIRVLIVDDSALVRRSVARLLEEDPAFSVIATAADGREAIEKVEALRPDVVTLDISMPVMDGLACLCELVRRFRQRVVMLSTLARDNSFPTFKALALGAVDFVTKPGEDTYLSTVEELGRELRQKVRLAAAIPAEKICRRSAALTELPASTPAPAKAPGPPSSVSRGAANVPMVLPGVPVRLIGVGGSTGGASALETVLRGLPAGLPLSILAVQHLPSGFTDSFARYLDSVGSYRVKVAREGEAIVSGTVYLAPASLHMRIQLDGQAPLLRLAQKWPAEGGYRPSIDILFYSLAAAEKHRAVGVLLSGMGEDGAGGLLAIHRMGGRTVAQDEATSVVFGMARRALERGAVDEMVPLEKIAAVIASSSGVLYEQPVTGRGR
ncbi:MAG: chemotaxis-specific protein-glutamate methyltransferase CheB [Thermoanaerobaculia bacterium]|nr:chemotaxis-specific protein-glutamate methyltransferase CheB [Thermoanaerobaculia bacterium]